MTMIFMGLKALFVVVLIIGFIWGLIWGGLMVYGLILGTIRTAWGFVSEQNEAFREFVRNTRSDKK